MPGCSASTLGRSRSPQIWVNRRVCSSNVMVVCIPPVSPIQATERHDLQTQRVTQDLVQGVAMLAFQPADPLDQPH